MSDNKIKYDIKYQWQTGKPSNSIKQNLFDTTSIISQISALVVAISIIIGNISIYKYLNYINFDFLFPDIIGDPSSAISITVNYILFNILLSLGFLSPFLINYFAYIEFDKDKESEINILISHILSMCFFILNTIIFIISLIYNFEYSLYIYFLCSLFLIIALRGYFYLYTIGDFSLFIFPFLALLPYFIYFLFSLKITVTTLDEENIQWIFFIFSVFIFILCHILAIIQFKSENKIIFIFLSILIPFFYYIYLIPFQNYNVSLYKARFIEKPQDSSWYLIHNGNTSSETINGMTKDDIKKYQKDLFNANDVTCDQIKKEKIKENCKKDYFNISKKDNAFYGYMAWNLGDTKVFCPASVDFFDGTDNTEKSKKCLVIDGRYLQLTSNYYIGNAITQ